MMASLAHCFLLALFLLGLTTLAARRSLSLLVVTNTTMMICVPILGASTLTAFGFSTNLGNIFLAAVMHGLAMQYYRYGAAEAHKAVYSMLFALLVVYGSIFVLEDMRMLNPMLGTTIRPAGAGFITFWLVQSLFVTLLDRYAPRQPAWPVPLITIATHALGTAMFFPCAFLGQLPPHLVLQFALAGWLAKAAVVVVSVPWLLWFRRGMRADAAGVA